MADKKLFLLDAYALIYRSYYAFIKSPRINSKGFNTSAILGFVNTLEEILKKENPTHIAVAFDPSGGTFRHEMYPEYKAQREETPEAIRLSVPIIKDVIRAYNIPVIEVKGFEADDVIGTLAKLAEPAGFDTYMMTPDKDYAQLVSEHIFMYRPKFGGNDFEIRGVEEVKAKFGVEHPTQVIDMLGLMGDASDNIPGCPGVGEKTAAKLIAQFGSIESLLENTDQLKGAIKTKVENNIEQIRFSKFLATIKTDVPLDFDEEELKCSPKNEAVLREMFEELEFRNLANRIFGKEAAPIPTDNTPQRSLFATTDTEEIVQPTLKGLKETSHTYYLVDTEEKAIELAAKLMAAKIFALDTETTSVEPMQAELVGMSFATAIGEAYYVPVPQERAEAACILRHFVRPLQNEQSIKVGQNIKYDLIVLQRYGLTVKGELFDTMIAHYLLQPELRHNLDYLAEQYLHYQTIHIEELIGAKGKKQLSMRQVPIEQVCDYAAEDADVTLRLKEVFEKELTTQGLETLFYTIEMPLVRVLTQLEMEGVRLDTEALGASSALLDQRIAQLEQEIFDLAGTTFNIASARQVGEVLFDKLRIDEKAKKTKTGQYSTTEEILEKLRPKHPIVGKILDIRGLRKLLSTYINALPELVNPITGKIHTSFNQTVTATGRLSSSNPNLQNIPIRNEDGKEVRRAFVAEPESLFLSADYSQIELRLMAHLSGDTAMIEAFNSGADIHAATAAKIYKLPIEQVTSDMRRKAKTANFGIIYGISVFGLSERLNIPRGEAKELIEGYFATYPQVKEYMNLSIEKAREQGYVETITGRKRMLPDINSRNSIVRGYAERNAINAPIQGGAADIIKVAMNRIAARFAAEKMEGKMILQVHDELNFTIPFHEVNKAERIVKEEMESAWQLAVPLLVEAGIGKNWLEAH